MAAGKEVKRKAGKPKAAVEKPVVTKPVKPEMIDPNIQKIEALTNQLIFLRDNVVSGNENHVKSINQVLGV